MHEPCVLDKENHARARAWTPPDIHKHARENARTHTQRQICNTYCLFCERACMLRYTYTACLFHYYPWHSPTVVQLTAVNCHWIKAVGVPKRLIFSKADSNQHSSRQKYHADRKIVQISHRVVTYWKRFDTPSTIFSILRQFSEHISESKAHITMHLNGYRTQTWARNKLSKAEEKTGTVNSG